MATTINHGSGRRKSITYSTRISSGRNRITNMNTNKPRLTIIVSLYNSGEWIENRLINLINTTTLNQSEIWCVNANSPDKRDHDVPQKYLCYKSVNYLKLDNRIGVYAAWNHIIKITDSIYITNANSDDTVSPLCYEKLMAVLDNNQTYDFAYPSWYNTTTPNQDWCSCSNKDDSGRPGNFMGDLGTAGVGHFPMWRRSLHHKLGYFNESLKTLADAEWWMRNYHKGGSKFYWVNELLGCYLWRNGENYWNKEISSEEWALFHSITSEYKK